MLVMDFQCSAVFDLLGCFPKIIGNARVLQASHHASDELAAAGIKHFECVPRNLGSLRIRKLLQLFSYLCCAHHGQYPQSTRASKLEVSAANRQTHAELKFPDGPNLLTDWGEASLGLVRSTTQRVHSQRERRGERAFAGHRCRRSTRTADHGWLRADSREHEGSAPLICLSAHRVRPARRAWQRAPQTCRRLKSQ